MHLLLLSSLMLSGAQGAGAPAVEIVVSEAAVLSLLEAASPIRKGVTVNLPVLGRVDVQVRLSNPRLSIKPAGATATFDFTATDAAGMLNLQGTVTPTMRFLVSRKRRVVEGRMVRATISLPGGLTIPIDDVVDPIALTSITHQEITLGDKVLVATMQANEVVLEKARARIVGVLTFAPKK